MAALSRTGGGRRIACVAGMARFPARRPLVRAPGGSSCADGGDAVRPARAGLSVVVRGRLRDLRRRSSSRAASGGLPVAPPTRSSARGLRRLWSRDGADPLARVRLHSRVFRARERSGGTGRRTPPGTRVRSDTARSDSPGGGSCARVAERLAGRLSRAQRSSRWRAPACAGVFRRKELPSSPAVWS